MSEQTNKPRRILLAGVFGPYGVDDDFGRRENIMELFHNQVTRTQGLASFRFFHRSFGLYFLAANVDAEVTVLDFPSRERFARELDQGYDLVGISFIAPNFKKAREMARITRERAPGAEIVLGGHGAAIEGIEDKIDCDHVVRGEGIRWLRRHLGQNPHAPITHPILPSVERNSIFGIPLPGRRASLLVPGVGCVNGCSFCSTSHFFGRSYSPFLRSGQALFDTACHIADETGSDEFFVMDENFLKDRKRALDMLELMERHERHFSFHIFSSAEAIQAFGLDALERLGVTFVWIGVESSSEQGNFEKNAGVDPVKLVAQLRARGIMVLASGILCAEHHTPDNIQAEIAFMIELKADFVQFMLLTPLPVTKLYQDLKNRGLLREDLPFEEWHGQKLLSYRHPAFSDEQVDRIIRGAFEKEHRINSSSAFRVTDTVFRGYQRLSKMGPLSPWLQARKDLLERKLRSWSVLLPVAARYPVDDTERQRAERLDKQVQRVLGSSLVERLRRAAGLAFAAAWKLRISLLGDGIQPKTLVTHYPAGRAQTLAQVFVNESLATIQTLERPRAAAAMGSLQKA